VDIETDAAPSRHNSDADWDIWPVTHYLAENYGELHPLDDAVLEHHSAFYRTIAPGSIGRSLEFGAGPNLYALMLAAGASRRIDAVELSAANVAYLERQLHDGPDESWRPFYERCRQLNPSLPDSLRDALRRVKVVHGNALDVRPGSYELASMNFVAEGVTESMAEFSLFCGAFVRSVRPGGYLVAAFMENLGTGYGFPDGTTWPACPVDGDTIHDLLAPELDDLTISRIDPDSTIPDYGYTGVVLLTARRAAAPGSRR
jgi:hypothetical protein